jgi:hypothetical protein
MHGRHGCLSCFVDVNLSIYAPIDMQSDDGNHQKQVTELMRETADSLDNIALKMLFVSVQQNNLELCIENAVK